MEVWFRMQRGLAFCSTACDISPHHTCMAELQQLLIEFPPVRRLITSQLSFSAYCKIIQSKKKCTTLPVSFCHGHKSPSAGFLQDFISGYCQPMSGAIERPSVRVRVLIRAKKKTHHCSKLKILHYFILVWVRVRELILILTINNKLAIALKTSQMFCNITLLSLCENTIDVKM